MKIEELFKKLNTGEKDDLECKSAGGGLPNSLWQSYSAMANTNGGTIILGVSEKGNEFIITGIEKVNVLLKDFWNTINNPTKVNANLLIDENVEILEINNNSVILINVPRAHFKQKPIYIGQNPFVGAYKRNFEGDYKCSEAEVKAMFVDQMADGCDNKILDKFTYEDFDSESLKAYRQRFAALEPDHPWNELNVVDFLKQIKAWGKNRETGKDGPTVAGLLFFGKNNSINEIFPDFFLDYREKISEDLEIRWDDRVYPDGKWEANLYQFYFKVIGRLTEGVKSPFKTDNLTRIDETHVHLALKEAFVNCLIHADFSLQTGIVIKKVKTGYSFSNPGRMKISPEIALEGGNSVPRNPILQRFFGLIKLGERAGSGLPKIIRAWKEQHWRNIELEEVTSPDKTVLRLWKVSLIPQECLKELREIYGMDLDILTKSEVSAVVTAFLEGHVTNKRMQSICEEHPYDLTRILQGLIEKQFLIKNEKTGRGTAYFLNKEYPLNEINLANSKNDEEEKVARKNGQKKWPEKVARKNGQKKWPENIDVENELIELEEKILQLINENKYITRVQLEEILKKDKSKVKRRIQVLKEKGLLKREGPDKGGYWVIVK